MKPTGPKLYLGNLLASLSLAFDLQESSQLEHHRRTAYIAERIGEEYGLEFDRLQNLFYAAMLHDIGTTEYSGIDDDDTQFREHPTKGAEILKSLPYLDSASDMVLYHHERVDGLGYPFGLTKSEYPVESQIIGLASAIEKIFAFAERNLDSLDPMVMIEHRLEISEGSEFDKDVVSAARSLFKQTRFWLDLEERNLNRVIDRMASCYDRCISSSDLNQIGEVFATLIDSKSPFTANHSIEVALYSVEIGKAMGLKGETLVKLHSAGLLHDLGKLGVPNRILNKPGPLTEREMGVIKAHPYYTEQILSDIKGLEDITSWASMHHEKLDGSGYPSGCHSKQIPCEARIIAVSDAFQAMVADRPYRAGLPIERAFELLDDGVAGGVWDYDVVQTLRNII